MRTFIRHYSNVLNNGESCPETRAYCDKTVEASFTPFSLKVAQFLTNLDFLNDPIVMVLLIMSLKYRSY